MTRMMWKLGAALVLGAGGIFALFWAVERGILMEFTAEATGVEADPPVSMYVMMFAGLLAMNIGVLSALTIWSKYLRQHPETRQLPVWLLVTLIVLAGASIVTAWANHAGYIRRLPQIPTEVSQGYIAFQTVGGVLVVLCLVLLGVRWAPGQKRQLRQS